jgi:membrane associated rhomboid family serine protease
MPSPAGSEQHTPGEPIFHLAPVVTSLIAICAGLYILQSYLFSRDFNFELGRLLYFIPVRYSAGAPTDISYFVAPIGYSTVHASFAHLTVNLIWLAAFGSPLAARIGAVRFLLFWAATAFGAAMLHLAIYPQSAAPLVGASGAISGMTGAAARFAFRTTQGGGVRSFSGLPMRVGAALTNRTVLSFMAIWMAANFAAGLGWPAAGGTPSNIAWEAHIGGFAIGFLALSLFDRPGSIPR